MLENGSRRLPACHGKLWRPVCQPWRDDDRAEEQRLKAMPFAESFAHNDNKYAQPD
ncbi:hypothetical protein DPPLL_14440 [Desulfofustis limnaeus]|uniref:Uncharacterized protein n=1 Tax=Desulfofustis limnaeus TaxID=2740163 RepID=A0ABM7W876_9BACT|nr:hypothetical protein DPPLL_14440 [Desulfofustis limnaeus]